MAATTGDWLAMKLRKNEQALVFPQLVSLQLKSPLAEQCLKLVCAITVHPAVVETADGLEPATQPSAVRLRAGIRKHAERKVSGEPVEHGRHVAHIFEHAHDD